MTRRRNGRANGGNGANGSTPGVIYCAVYTRKSTDEGLDRDFNTLDAQRESAEAYIQSQAGNGWVLLPDRYDDGGFSGGNLERPALQRLLANLQTGKIQKIIVYKIDRLSRSLMDFSELARLFEEHGVGIVSVTQQLDTSTSMGRLTLNMLLSFAQFEREMVSDRTRDKLRAARRKGKFTGGGLILGYDRHPDGGRLVINPAEAKRVVAVFQLFLETGSLIETVQELNRRGWTLKAWTTKDGKPYGGGRFDVHNLRRMLTNHAYVGQVAFDGQTFEGEHEAIVDRETWEAVQELIATGSRGPRRPSTKNPALLGGLLRCAPCNAAMTRMYSQRNGVQGNSRRYFYYQCIQRYRRGRNTCPTSNLAARAIEQFVVSKLKAIGRDPELIAATVEAARRTLADRRSELDTEIYAAQKALDAAHAAARAKIAAAGIGKSRRRGDDGTDADIPALEERVAQLRDELAALRDLRIDPADLRVALASFDPLWDHLTSAERARVVQLLIERIDYDGAAGKIGITFSPSGVRIFAAEAADGPEVAP